MLVIVDIRCLLDIQMKMLSRQLDIEAWKEIWYGGIFGS
jgi:hypothetical protein